MRENEEMRAKSLKGPPPVYIYIYIFIACNRRVQKDTGMQKSNERTELDRQSRLRKALKQAKRLVFLNVTAWLIMVPARPEIILKITKGDALRGRVRPVPSPLALVFSLVL